jgi:trans-aconitate methyltransferase
MSFATRSDAPERMDTDCAGFADYRRCLRDLSRVNRVTLTGRPTLAWLGRRGLRPGDRFSLLDVAFGYGDILRSVRRWSDRRGLDPVLTGIDLNPWAADAARAATPAAARIAYLTGDVFGYAPAEPPDFIVSSQFAHHLTDTELAGFIRWMERTARRGWLIADIERSRLAWAGFAVLATAAGWHRLVRSDGLISIARSFRPAELAARAAEAGLAGSAAVHRHVPFRLTLERAR